MSHNQVLDDSPWLAPEAIVQMGLFLESIPAPMIFEWGAGGSSLWFAERAAIVVSVEHNPEWHEQTLRELDERKACHVTLQLIPETNEYAQAIHTFKYKYNLILVDGVQRNACVLAALDCLWREREMGGTTSPASWLVLDNTERETEYAEALSLLKDWQRKDYQGDGFQTSIFVKP